MIHQTEEAAGFFGAEHGRETVVKGEVDKGNPIYTVSGSATAGLNSFKEETLGGNLVTSFSLKQILLSDLN